MNAFIVRIASILAVSFWITQAFAQTPSYSASSSIGVSLSPNQIGGGAIPRGYAKINFSMSDGNWAPTVTLPNNAADKAIVVVTNRATFKSTLMLGNTDVLISSLVLATNDSYQFTFSAGQNRWLIGVLDISPNQAGAVIPSVAAKLSRYTVSLNNWTPNITLPALAQDGAIIIIRSQSQQETQILPMNVLYASTMRLMMGDQFALAYRADIKKWHLIYSPVHAIDLRQLRFNAITATYKPITQLTIPAAAPSITIALPSTAGDRDRIRVASLSNERSSINNAGVNFAGSMGVQKGDSYEFMWVAEKNHWAVMSAPVRSYMAQALAAGSIPAMTTPRVFVTATNDSWQPVITLPTDAKLGDRVVVRSEATSSFNVTADVGALQAAPLLIANGDTRSFVRTDKGAWESETIIINILNVYSDRVANVMGEQAARARQIESVRLTNEALENSQANFRVKMVGLMRYRDQGTLGDAISNLRSDAIVQAERKRVKANAIYYEGAESGCGLGYMNAVPNARNMVAAGSINCGTTAMRHEFGHNMGLDHGDASRGGSSVYAKGYSLMGTIMGGNSIPFYSTPKLYDSNLGMPIGIENKIDAVRAMNERSNAVAAF